MVIRRRPRRHETKEMTAFKEQVRERAHAVRGPQDLHPLPVPEIEEHEAPETYPSGV